MAIRILIVDDSLFTRKLLTDIFQKEGFIVCGEAANGREAVKKYNELKPDLITMDIVMPDMEDIDGIGAIKEIRQNDPKAKIIVISAMSQNNLVIEAIHDGVKDFIIKPIEASRVIESVRRII